MATEKKIGDNVVNVLKKSITDIEDFQVQLALGKAEAHDKYEELKKKFRRFLNDARQKYAGVKSNMIIAEFEELQVQLALGKADSADAFNAQKKKIFSAVSRLEKYMENKSRAVSKEVQEEIRHEVERFRLKMEMLRIQYELGKLEAKDQFEDKKHDLAAAVAKLRTKYNAWVFAKKRQERHAQLKKAYRDMNKAFLKRA